MPKSLTSDKNPLGCLFCGHAAKVNELRRGNRRRTGDNYQVTCNGCRCRGPLVKDSEAEAIRQWNAMQRGQQKWEITKAVD